MPRSGKEILERADEFDEVVRSDGIRAIRAPVRAPRARAQVERWDGTLRHECLDRLLIFGRRQLESVLAATRSTTTNIALTERSNNDRRSRSSHPRTKGLPAM